MSISVDMLNITTNTWTNFPSFSNISNLRHLACSMVGDDTIAISGGIARNVSQNSVWTWNIESQVWKRLPDLNVPRHSHGKRFFVDWQVIRSHRLVDGSTGHGNSLLLFQEKNKKPETT